MSQEQKILTLGILSLVCCPILGPFAWIRANDALSTMNLPGFDSGEIDRQGYDPSERGLVAAGQVCGIIGTGLLVVSGLGLLVQIITGSH